MSRSLATIDNAIKKIDRYLQEGRIAPDPADDNKTLIQDVNLSFFKIQIDQEGELYKLEDNRALIDRYCTTLPVTFGKYADEGYKWTYLIVPMPYEKFIEALTFAITSDQHLDCRSGELVVVDSVPTPADVFKSTLDGMIMNPRYPELLRAQLELMAQGSPEQQNAATKIIQAVRQASELPQ